MTPTTRMRKLTDEQRKLCENAYDRTGIKLKGGCTHAKATQMVTVKYPHLTITPVAFCDKCASKVKREANKYGYTVQVNKIVPMSSD